MLKKGLCAGFIERQIDTITAEILACFVTLEKKILTLSKKIKDMSIHRRHFPIFIGSPAPGRTVERPAGITPEKHITLQIEGEMETSWLANAGETCSLKVYYRGYLSVTVASYHVSNSARTYDEEQAVLHLNPVN